MEIRGAAALVTGGASGLGEATARRLSEAGAIVTVVDLPKQEERGTALVKELGGGAQFAPADVTDVEAVTAAVAAAAESAPLRITINCAGLGWAQRTIGRDGTAHDFDAFKFVVNVNLIGTFNVIRLAASQMSKSDPGADNERGVIVNTASVAAFDGQIGQASYSASKGGVVAMTLPIARDLAAAGIRVNTIAPGLMDTPLLGQLPEEARAALISNVVFPKRLGVADDYAQLAISIVENPYLNGETIRLDGALRMPPK